MITATMPLVETRSLGLSILLHLAALLIAAFGLPMVLPEKPEPMPLVMTVDLLPISAMTNVKPSKEPIQEEKKAEAVKNPKPIPPTITEPPKPQPAPEEKKPFDPTEEAMPAEKVKPKEPEKPKDDQKKKNQDFEALLNKLKAEAEKTKDKTAKDETTTPKNTTTSDAPYDDSIPLSLSEKDSIRSQFIPCWTMPAGAKDAHTLSAVIKIKLRPDGSVIDATLLDAQRGRYAGDMFFRAAADSAIRAVHKCSPLKNLPTDKYNSWKEMELEFDPSKAL